MNKGITLKYDAVHCLNENIFPWFQWDTIYFMRHFIIANISDTNNNFI